AELVNSNKLKDSNAIEGEVTFIEYESAEGVTATQIYRTFEIQLVKAGFKLVFSCRSADCGNMPMHFVRNYIDGSEDLGNSMVEKKGSFIVATGSHENETYYVIIVVGENSHEKMSRYVINIIKQENLDTNKVDVASVSDKIKMEGSYAFYGIQFDLNSAVLKPEADESLDLMADYLARFSDLKVLIVGHTDNSGEFEMNKVLSEKRAEAVVSVLISKYKIDRKRLTPVGVGMASPKASNANEEGKSINRRVEIVLK
ncbi:OmpA family protein, partial [Algoriphagus aquimarinus]